MGVNINVRVSIEICKWWSGPCLFEQIDVLAKMRRFQLKSFRFPILECYKDMGTIVVGKCEQGTIKVGDFIVLMPNRTVIKIVMIYKDGEETLASKAGENLSLKIDGVGEDEVSVGFILCSLVDPVPVASTFIGYLAILDLLDHKSIFSPGYKCVLHNYCASEECEIVNVFYSIDLKSKEKKKVRYAKSGELVIAKIRLSKALCVEIFESVPYLGRFTLRDEGKTIAVGKIVLLPRQTKIEPSK